MQFYSRPSFRALFALVSLALLGFVLASCSGGDDDSPGATGVSGAIATATTAPETSATPRPASPTSASSTATPGATPGATAAAEAIYNGYEIFGDFAYAEPVDFPEDFMLLVETGCTQCESGPDALYRVWRNEGETHVELLVDAAISDADDAQLTSIAVSPSLHDIVATVCSPCENAPVADSMTVVYRSIDGGITWREVLRTETGEVVYARAVTPEGIVLEAQDGGLSYLRGDAIQPPDGASALLPHSDRTGALRWLADGGRTVVDAQGNPVAIVEPGALINGVVGGGDNGAANVVGWGVSYVQGPFEGWVVTLPGPDGKLAGFRFDTPIVPVSVLDEGSVLGSLSSQDSPDGGIIGFIDALRGRLTPIHGPLLQAPFGNGQGAVGRNDPLGAATGPFLRVVSGSNCLPIRVDTNAQSQELTCAADGTLVYDLNNTTTVGAQEWERVRLLDGREGYTVTAYLTAE